MFRDLIKEAWFKTLKKDSTIPTNFKDYTEISIIDHKKEKDINNEEEKRKKFIREDR